MKIDVWGAVKDNRKLLLSVAGVCLVIIIMVSAGSSEGGFFSLWDYGTGVDDIANGGGTGNSNSPTPVNNGNNSKYNTFPSTELGNADYQAVIQTSMGNITLDLYEDLAPLTVRNFVFLANEGFYDGSSFHRVVSNFVIQGGDPLGNGTGGPGYKFRDEIRSDLDFGAYTLAMANSGPNTNGSQFFITTRSANVVPLNGKYTIFGEVINGFNTVDRIEGVEVAPEGNRYEDMPLTPVLINRIVIVER